MIKKLKIYGVFPFFIILIIWYALTENKMIDFIFLPSPFIVLNSLLKLSTKDFILTHLFASFFRVAIAFLISVLVAFPIGIISGQNKIIQKLIQPIFGFTRYIPVASIVPLCILWFGIGDIQKIAVITIGVVFQLVLLLSYDSASVPKELIESGCAFGLNRYQIIKRIVIPYAMPAIWDHLRISAGWAWSYLVLSELVAGNNGIGYFIVESQRYLETDKVFAGIIFIGILGMGTDILFRIAAQRLFKWQ